MRSSCPRSSAPQGTSGLRPQSTHQACKHHVLANHVMGGSARTSTACFLCQWHVWWQGHTISPPLRAWPTSPRQPSRFAWIVNTEIHRAGRRGEAVACGSDESRGAPTIARCGDKKDLTFGAASPHARTPGSPSGIHDSPVPRKEVLHWAAFLTFLRASRSAVSFGIKPLEPRRPRFLIAAITALRPDFGSIEAEPPGHGRGTRSQGDESGNPLLYMTT